MKEEVNKFLAPITSSQPSSSVIIVVDGWMDPTRHPFSNFKVSSKNEPVFVKLIDARGKYKDVHYMAELFIELIEEVNVDSFVQIITGNALVRKVTSMIVEPRYSKIFGHLELFVL